MKIINNVIKAAIIGATITISGALVQGEYDLMLALSDEEAYNEYGFEIYEGETLFINPNDKVDFFIAKDSNEYEPGKKYYVKE